MVCCCCLVAKSCLTLWDPMNCSMPGSPVLHCLPLSWWCYLTTSSSAVPFSSCSQYFPASGSFPVSQLFASGSQSIGASVSVLPMNIQDWFPLGLTGLISLQSKGLSMVSSTTIWTYHFFGALPSLWSSLVVTFKDYVLRTVLGVCVLSLGLVNDL